MEVCTFVLNFTISTWAASHQIPMYVYNICGVGEWELGAVGLDSSGHTT